MQVKEPLDPFESVMSHLADFATSPLAMGDDLVPPSQAEQHVTQIQSEPNEPLTSQLKALRGRVGLGAIEFQKRSNDSLGLEAVICNDETLHWP